MTKGNYSIVSWRWKIFQSSRTYACKWQHRQQQQDECVGKATCIRAMRHGQQQNRERNATKRAWDTCMDKSLLLPCWLAVCGGRGVPGKVNKQYGGVGLPWSSKSSDWYRHRPPGATIWPKRPAPRFRWPRRLRKSAFSWKAAAPPRLLPLPPIRAWTARL